MKNLFFVLALFCASLIAHAQAADTLTISSNPTSVSLGDTDVTMINFTRGTFNDRMPDNLVLLIKFPATNVGTVQINTYSATMTLSPLHAADTYLWITVRDRFYIKLSNSADDVEISW